jgi:PAS domain S-box-containing protein
MRALMDSLPDHIYFKDAQSRFLRMNQSLARFFGLGEPEEGIGKSDINFFPFETARQKLEDERRVTISGEAIINLVEKSETDDGAVWVSTTKVPMRDADGKITGLVGISRDVTSEKRAEEHERSLEAQLNQAQKLEAIGQLAAGIAHEINTPTQYVGDNTRFVQDAFQDVIKVLRAHEELVAAARNDAVTPELLDQAEALIAASDLEYISGQIPAAIAETLEGVGRIAKIVRAMKEFSHPGSKEKTPADLNRAIESTVIVAHNEWKYVADVQLDLSPDIPAVPCFLGEFNHAYPVNTYRPFL